MDRMTPEQRHRCMSHIRDKETGPEWAVRRLVHALGFRYRLHVKGLPGKPDLVLARHRKVIFVHGCFWHRHKDCERARLPNSRGEFWLPKLQANATRDARNARRLRNLGWGVMTIWECQLIDIERLTSRIRRFLNA